MSDQKKLLIFIVAYNAEKTIKQVLSRLPRELFDTEYEILIIDDHSKDQTFEHSKDVQSSQKDLNLTVLFNPENLGYGGNQKLGYQYAIDNGFDAVVLLHGDGQYPPEMVCELSKPVLDGECAAVFGSRMMKKGGALAGGMPLYKYVGNRILSTFQNFILKMNLSEFHSGFRSYSVETLKKVPFDRNTDDFHFDTEIIIQVLRTGGKIHEIPIPTYYGDEICHVNGLKYAWDVVRTTLLSRAHDMSFLYQRKFDMLGTEDRGQYDLKLGYPSSHSFAIESVKPKAQVLDIGCNTGYIGQEIKKKECHVTGMDILELSPKEVQNQLDSYIQCDLDNLQDAPEMDRFDQILCLDVIEHLADPELFLDTIREKSKSKRPKITFTTGNIAFFIIRLQLFFFSKFNYGKQGILDKTHKRLFTFQSMKDILQQSGFVIESVRGIPAPFPKALGNNFLSRGLVAINMALIRVSKSLFSYQIYVEAHPTPTVNQLLKLSHRGKGSASHATN